SAGRRKCRRGPARGALNENPAPGQLSRMPPHRRLRAGGHKHLASVLTSRNRPPRRKREARHAAFPPESSPTLPPPVRQSWKKTENPHAEIYARGAILPRVLRRRLVARPASATPSMPAIGGSPAEPAAMPRSQPQPE